MAITRQSGFPVESQTTAQNPTQAITTVAVGDVLIVAGKTNAITDTVSAVSGGNATGWQKVDEVSDATQGRYSYMWMGVVNAVGAATVIVNCAASNVTEIVVDSFTAGLGAGTSWSLDVHGTSDNVSSTTITYPSLTPPNAGSIYWGFACVQNTGSGAGTTGYTYNQFATTGNLAAFNATVAQGVATQPLGSQTAGRSIAVAGVLTASAGALSYVNTNNTMMSRMRARAR